MGEQTFIGTSPIQSAPPIPLTNDIFSNVIFQVALYAIAITAVIACIYLCVFFIKKLVQQFKPEKINKT